MIGATLLATLAVGFYYLYAEQPADSTPRSTVNSGPDNTATEPSENVDSDDVRSTIAARYGLTEEELQRKTRQRAYQQAAEARFKQAVKMDGLHPDAVDPDVRALFKTLTLDPVIDTQNTRKGSVNGMRIADLSKRNPLADAGFTTGDRLTRINGVALNDPAQIAHLFTRIENHMEVCAERSGKEYCEHVTL